MPPGRAGGDLASQAGVHANRLAGIDRTILCIARPERQSPEAKARLAAFAEEYARRQGELERAADQLREERDEAVRAAYKDGLPMKAIAEVMGMSHQRVSQIVRS
ncbi:MAG: sigma factor-like helix-turn-helix DNA-binding protein [Solirubrobacterales bacterium]